MYRLKIILILLIVSALLSEKNGNAFWGAKHEPADGFVYHGAQSEVRPASIYKRHVDWEGIEEYVRTSGHRPKIIMHYITLDFMGFYLLKDTINDIFYQPHDYMLQIGLDFYSYFPNYDAGSPNDITEKIAKGEYDDSIRELAEMLRKHGSPVFLRPGYEFGGTGQGRHASKTYWVDAWKRVYELFQKAKASNVAFIWNTLDAKDFMEYYPGDNFVDWWGINVFLNHADKDSLIHAFITMASERKKPVMISESTPRYVGSIGGATSWDLWYEPYFNLIKNHENIKAFCYINASWSKYLPV